MSRLAVMLAAVLAVFSINTPAKADVVEWEIRSTYPYIVHLEFYSQDYNRAWPGDGKAYVLDDSAFHTFRLNCESGEKICYGAWVSTDSDTYWGAGRDDAHGCEACCRTCGYNYDNSITLRE